MTLILFIITLAILVLVHELGHFLAAKRTGVRVEEFGFGLPPRLFGKKIGETLYSINLLPFGGFVKLFGEEYHEIKKKTSSSVAFINKTPLQKTMIVIGGVIGNFLLGWFIFSYLLTVGLPVPTNKVIVDKVVANSPASQAGLKEKDIILSFLPPTTPYLPTEASPKVGTLRPTPYTLTSPNTMISLTKKYSGQEIELIIKRADLKLPIKVTPRRNPPKNQGPLGIYLTSFMEKKYPWYSALFYGLIEATNISLKIISELGRTLINVFSFQKTKVEVAGPVGIANLVTQAVKFGKNAYLEILALLSFNLAIFNILPFPALDGGRLMFVLYEGIAKKKPNKNIEKYANLVGIIILLSLVMLITINDIIKLYR